MIKEVKVFETDDGKVFSSKELSEKYDYVSKKLTSDGEWEYNHDELKFVKTVSDWKSWEISLYIVDLKIITRNFNRNPYFNLTRIESIKKNNFNWEYAHGVEYLYFSGNNVEELVQSAMKMVEYLE